MSEQQQQQQPAISLQFTKPMLDVVTAGLQELPFKIASPVLQSLQMQIDEISKAAQAEEKSEEKSETE